MKQRRKPVYEPDVSDRRKHKEGWDRPEPGLARDADGHLVGKCPTGISLKEAQRLLDDGLPFRGRFGRSPYPERIYNVWRGVPYHAHQKAAGRYHGFPELPSNVPPTILERLRNRAEEQGDSESFEA